LNDAPPMHDCRSIFERANQKRAKKIPEFIKTEKPIDYVGDV
jgi:hypothetical protein